jgi:hypothetical protein
VYESVSSKREQEIRNTTFATKEHVKSLQIVMKRFMDILAKTKNFKLHGTLMDNPLYTEGSLEPKKEWALQLF